MGSIFETKKEEPNVLAKSLTEEGQVDFHVEDKPVHKVKVFFGSICDLERITRQEYAPSEERSLGLFATYFESQPHFMDLIGDIANDAYKKFRDNVDVVSASVPIFSSPNKYWYSICYALKKK